METRLTAQCVRSSRLHHRDVSVTLERVTERHK